MTVYHFLDGSLSCFESYEHFWFLLKLNPQILEMALMGCGCEANLFAVYCNLERKLQVSPDDVHVLDPRLLPPAAFPAAVNSRFKREGLVAS